MTQKYKTLKDLARIISLFNNLEVGELGVAEISRELTFAPSKVSRMLKTFEDDDFFKQNPDTGKYRLGPRFFELGLAYAYQLPMRKLMRPHIEQLAEQLKMTVSWGIINQNRVIVLDRIQMMGLDLLAHRIGTNLPIHSTSIGKVLLAHLPEKELNQILRSIKLVKYTKQTVVDPKLIRKNLNLIREKGYAYDERETAENTICIAAPIKDGNGAVTAAINLTDVISNTSPDQMMKHVPLLRDRALFISRQLGYEENLY